MEFLSFAKTHTLRCARYYRVEAMFSERKNTFVRSFVKRENTIDKKPENRSRQRWLLSSMDREEVICYPFSKV